MKPAEKNYSATEREALGAKEALVKFQPFIEGERIILVTDHAALQWARVYENANQRLAAWGAKICDIRKGRCKERVDSFQAPGVLDAHLERADVSEADLPRHSCNGVDEEQPSDTELDYVNVSEKSAVRQLLKIQEVEDIVGHQGFASLKEMGSSARDPGAAHQGTGTEREPRVNCNKIDDQVYEFLRKLDGHGLVLLYPCRKRPEVRKAGKTEGPEGRKGRK
jgi:hypothetical protein